LLAKEASRASGCVRDEELARQAAENRDEPDCRGGRWISQNQNIRYSGNDHGNFAHAGFLLLIEILRGTNVAVCKQIFCIAPAIQATVFSKVEKSPARVLARVSI